MSKETSHVLKNNTEVEAPNQREANIFGDAALLATARDWRKSGAQLTLITLLNVSGSSPRREGAISIISNKGQIVGSVSGGCIEEDLIRRYGEKAAQSPKILSYGKNQQEAEKFRLPCGAQLDVIAEPFNDDNEIDELFNVLQSHEKAYRRLNITTGMVHIEKKPNEKTPLVCDKQIVKRLFGNNWIAYIVGANDVSAALITSLSLVGIECRLCDPRPNYVNSWRHPDYNRENIIKREAEDFINGIHLDENSAVIFVAHDNKIEDLAILSALTSKAAYIGALGSQKTTQSRQQRLIDYFDAQAENFRRLDAPIGFDLKSRTSAEIAIAITAKIIAVRNERFK